MITREETKRFLQNQGFNVKVIFLEAHKNEISGIKFNDFLNEYDSIFEIMGGIFNKKDGNEDRIEIGVQNRKTIESIYVERNGLGIKKTEDSLRIIEIDGEKDYYDELVIEKYVDLKDYESLSNSGVSIVFFKGRNNYFVELYQKGTNASIIISNNGSKSNINLEYNNYENYIENLEKVLEEIILPVLSESKLSNQKETILSTIRNFVYTIMNYLENRVDKRMTYYNSKKELLNQTLSFLRNSEYPRILTNWREFSKIKKEDAIAMLISEIDEIDIKISQLLDDSPKR